MKKRSDALPEFEKPPLVEVVCDIQFEPLENLIVPHIGLFWDSIKKDFPQINQFEPILPIFEDFSNPYSKLRREDKIPTLIPRIWFVQKNQNILIQVQNDRFILNWRKISANDKYPRYEKVIEKFKIYLEMFRKFLIKNKIGDIKPIQYEMAYVNHIAKGSSWESLNDINQLFPDFNWDTKNKEIFLGKIDGINLQTRFELPNQTGRLYIKIQDVFDSNKDHIIALEIKVRGIGTYKSYNSYEKWFDLAHQWIVKSFASITSTNTQKNVWRRIK